MNFVNQNNSNRPNGPYSEVIKKIAKDSVCPFCSENISKYHPNPLIENKFWWSTDNAYPYKPTRNHLLIVHKEHITEWDDISPEAWTELHEIISQESKKRTIDGGTFMMRFGDTKYTGASVSHLHAQLVQSDPDDPSYDRSKGLLTRIG